MGTLRSSNLDQTPFPLDYFAGPTAALSQAFTLPGAARPLRLETVTCLFLRRTDPSPGKIGAGTMIATLGTTPFGAEIANSLAHPDWLEEGVLQPQTIPFYADIAAVPATAGTITLYFTLFAPREQAIVETGHVTLATGAFTALSSETDGTLADLAAPLALTLAVTTQASALLADVTSIQAVDHGYFTEVLTGTRLLKKTRLTLWKADFGLAAPPYRTEADLPTVSEPVVLRQVVTYQTTHSDRFTAGSLSLQVALPEFQAYRALFQENAMLTLDERFSDGEKASGWVRRGTFFIDRISDSVTEDGARTVTLECRDAMKLLMSGSVAERFAPDKIWVPRKSLKRIRDGYRDNLPMHVFIDGDSDPAHPGQVLKTVMWAEKPEVRIWKQGSGERIKASQGSVDVLHRDGEVWIEREFYRATKYWAGLNNPAGIDVAYYRYARPHDEALVRVASAGSNWLAIQGAVSQAWKGATVIVTDGAQAATRLQVTSIGSGRLLFTHQEDRLAGILPGDTLQVGYANRVEDVVRRVLLLCGFQDLDSRAPFYIENVLPPPTANAIMLPDSEDFDFRYERARSGYDILQQIGNWLPPSTQYKANALGNVATLILNPASAPTYDATATVKRAEKQSNDQDAYTRVVYPVRDKRSINLIGGDSPAVKRVTLSEARTPVGKTLLEAAFLEPANFLGHLTDKRERIRRAITDGTRGTGVTWQVVIDVGDSKEQPPLNRQGNFDGQWLIMWELDKLYRLQELHIRGIKKDWIQEQFMEIEVSRDGAAWVTATDEFKFENPDDPYRTFTVDDNTFARFIRLSVTHAALAKSTKKADRLSGTLATNKWSEAVTVSDLFVFAADIVEGIAELGVDRFEGETDAAFARDQEMRTRFSRRTLTVQPVDEQGYAISMAMGLSLEQYAKAKALEYLAEYTTEFNTVRVDGLRPDANIGDMPTLALPGLGLTGAQYLLREVTTSHEGTIQALGTDYRFQGAVSGEIEEPPPSGTVGALSSDPSRSLDDANDWSGYVTL